MSHKERKTQFVSDLVGGSTADIYAVTSISAVSYLVWCVLKKRSTLFEGTRKHESPIATIIDFLLNWNNLLLSTTIYADNIPLLILLNVLPLIPVLLSSSTVMKKQVQHTRKAVVNLKKITMRQFLPFKTYITVYRAQMMVITCICIMAVDFQVFPRRFGKVETWGTSLMDLGVGSFVFSMGLISARSYLGQLFESKFSYSRTIIKSFKNSIPIFILGFVRLISVKSVDYHEHVTEYGKHWNFFFTLGFLPILNAIFAPFILRLSPLVSSLLISIFYEYLLLGGVLEYIIVGPRDTLVGANREGIFSLFGYFPIFLNGLALGSSILPVISIPNSLFKIGISREALIKQYKTKGKVGMSPLKAMFILSVVFQLTYYIIDTCYIYSVSRRMANLLYVIWVSAYNCTFLFLYGLIEEKLVWGKANVEVVTDAVNGDGVEIDTNTVDIVSDKYVPTSLTAVNNNSLLLFLLSNLLTGLINLTFNTIDASDFVSMAILIFYELVLAGISIVLYKRDIIIR